MPESVKPPQTAASLLSLFASEPDFPQIEGDLSEEFHQRMRMNGLRSARRWYWRETFRNVLVFIKRPRILQVLAVAALCIVVFRSTLPPYVHWLRTELREMPRVPGLLLFLLFLFRMSVSLALGIVAGHILRGRERMLMLAFTVLYLLAGHRFLFLLWVSSQVPLYLKTFNFINFCCTIIGFWIATRWSARRNRQRSIA